MKEKNTDLRVLTNRIKLFKCFTIIFTILSPVSLLGVGMKYPYSYFFVALCILFFIVAVTFAVLMQKTIKQENKTVKYLKEYRDHLVLSNSAINGYLTATYVNINYKECGELGYVTFARENLVFSAEGVYSIVKDFKGIEGKHIAIQIRGTKLVSDPVDGDNGLDYGDTIFTLNIGYFEDCPLTEENDTGLLLPEGDYIGRIVIPFSSNCGYVCNLDTEEADDIDRGELVILEMTENSLVISFKCMVGYGAAEVIYGTVKLMKEPQSLN